MNRKNKGKKRSAASCRTDKRYQKPEITEVTLIPEEAILANCKAATPVTSSKSRRCQSDAACGNRILGS